MLTLLFDSISKISNATNLTFYTSGKIQIICHLARYSTLCASRPDIWPRSRHKSALGAVRISVNIRYIPYPALASGANPSFLLWHGL